MNTTHLLGTPLLATRQKLSALRNAREIHLEASRGCNLDCIYCYGRKSENAKNLHMPLKVACKYISIILRNTCSIDIEVVFHGGEPLLQSSSWYYNVIEFGSRVAKESGKQLLFRMQSNCTLLDDDKLDLIREFRIMVGSSLDGPPAVNDLSRRQGALVIENIQKLRKIGCSGGVICVINKHNYDKMKETMGFFHRERLQSVSLITGHCVGQGRSLGPLNPEMLFSAYRDVYTYFEDTMGKGTIETNIAGKLSRFVHPPSREDFRDLLICSHPFCGAGITTIFCDIEGNLWPCGCSVANHVTKLANIDLISDDEYIARAERFHEKPKRYFEECGPCEAAKICGFGCPAFDSIDKDTMLSECEANKMFYCFLKEKERPLVAEIAKQLEERSHGRKSID